MGRFVVAGSLLALLSCAGMASAAAESTLACSAPQYRQFDFFAGDWDTYDLQSSDPKQVIARNTVEIILDGCVIHEDYRQNDGHHGESYSLYDAARKVWHQSWVTNRGELLLLDGGWKDGALAFDGVQHGKDGKDGKSMLVHVVWIPQGKNVRETATQSGDDGKTWQSLFDILFKPHR